MFTRYEIALRPQIADLQGERLAESLRSKGIAGIDSVRIARVYHIENLSTAKGEELHLERLGRELLADAVAEHFTVNLPIYSCPDCYGVIEVAKLAGVMDPVEQSVAKAVSDLGYLCGRVRTSTRYYIQGQYDLHSVANAAKKLIANEVIERVIVGGFSVWHEQTPPPYDFHVHEINILDASDDELMRISREGTLSLSLEEMKTVQAHFAEKKRNPTDIELESIAQTWSEHCVHKTMKGVIDFDGEIVDNLLKSTIAAATHKLNKPWCVSVFKDNAGVIEFDEEYDVTFKVETHNHPSALEPYGGAGTGIGGVIRDTLGTGLGAKPILNTDVFCFGPLDMKDDDVPAGALHPKRVCDGVVSGVRDYGNRMGIPTANGAVYFDPRYTGNPLVYCGSVGIIPRGKTEKAARSGDLIVALGGRTGRDGIHGATFSSVELTSDSEVISSGAVQIGNAIEEKKLTDAILQARDAGLYTAITDCGAGGFSSAVGEMGAECGASVNLDGIPLKYEGLSYTEIWISEAQERMVLAVPPENEGRLREICDRERVEMTVIGVFTNTGRLELFYKGTKVGDLDMDFLHNGVPRTKRTATWKQPESIAPLPVENEDFGETLLKLLESPNIASKEWIIRQYDHEVQGTSVLKPLVGIEHDGPGDAAIIAPRYGVNRGLIVSNGMNPRYGDLDPYRMAASGIDESLRQIIAVGGDIDRAAILDNFSWADTKRPEQLGALVLAAKACSDYSLAFETPFISGKDSLNNTFNTGKEIIMIPPTLLISAIAVLDDLNRARTMDLKRAGNFLYIIGFTHNEMAGSHYHLVHGLQTGGVVPDVAKKLAPKIFKAMGKANRKGLFESLHDLSEGGLAVAAAEMAFAGGLGANIDISGLPIKERNLDPATLLFSESNTRWLVEVAPENAQKIAKALAKIPHAKIGFVSESKRLKISLYGKTLIDIKTKKLKRAWQNLSSNV